MALFQFGRKKVQGSHNVSGIIVAGEAGRATEKLLKNTKKAVDIAGMDIEVQLVSDQEEIQKLGVKSTPALLVNDQVISSGRVLRQTEVEALLNSNWAI